MQGYFSKGGRALALGKVQVGPSRRCGVVVERCGAVERSLEFALNNNLLQPGTWGQFVLETPLDISQLVQNSTPPTAAEFDSLPTELRNAIIIVGKCCDLPSDSERVLADRERLQEEAAVETMSPRHLAVYRNGMHEKLLVVGGFSGRRLNVVECFDPVSNTWATLPNMRSLRTGCCAGGLPGSGIIVAGGYAGGNYDLDTCEGVSLGDGPQQGEYPRQWHSLPSMQRRRRGSASSVWRDCFVVVGGCGDDGQVLGDCEMYVSVSGRWVQLPPLIHPRSACAAVTVTIVFEAGQTVGEECVMVLGGVDTIHIPIECISQLLPCSDSSSTLDLNIFR